MSTCNSCKGLGRIPQRGAEFSGSREVCPVCNGTGQITGIQVTPVVAPEVQPETAPKGDGADASETGSVEAPE